MEIKRAKNEDNRILSRTKLLLVINRGSGIVLSELVTQDKNGGVFTDFSSNMAFQYLGHEKVKS